MFAALAVVASLAVTSSAFGTMPDGTRVDVFTLKNGHGVEVRIITYGAAILDRDPAPDLARHGLDPDVLAGGYLLYVSRLEPENQADLVIRAYRGVPGDIPLVADFDGDHRADLVVFRPSNGRGYYSLAADGYGPAGWGSLQWGTSGDYPLIGDFDGDSRTDLAVYRPSTSEWFLWMSSGNVFPGSVVVVRWGGPGDQPLVGDFDGDDRTDIAIFRPSENNWYVLYSGARFTSAAVLLWGGYGDIPIVH